MQLSTVLGASEERSKAYMEIRCRVPELSNNEMCQLRKILLCFYSLNDLGKDRSVMFGELREDFSVEFDICLFQAVDKLAIGKPMFSARRIDLYLPKSAKRAFLYPAITVCVDTRFEHRGAGKLDGLLATVGIALYCFQ